MQIVSELALPHLPLESPTFAVDPMPYIEAARRQHPWLARCDFGYVVHEYQAIRDLSYMDDKFRPSMDTITEIMGAKGTPWGEFMDNLMLAKTGAEHARIRRSVEASFTPKNISRYRPLMQDRVSRLLDEWAPKGAFDFAEFAAYFPITVMFGLMGASPGGHTQHSQIARDAGPQRQPDSLDAAGPRGGVPSAVEVRAQPHCRAAA